MALVPIDSLNSIVCSFFLLICRAYPCLIGYVYNISTLMYNGSWSVLAVVRPTPRRALGVLEFKRVQKGAHEVYHEVHHE